jgi:hypothetical protein
MDSISFEAAVVVLLIGILWNIWGIRDDIKAFRKKLEK